MKPLIAGIQLFAIAGALFLAAYFRNSFRARVASVLLISACAAFNAVGLLTAHRIAIAKAADSLHAAPPDQWLEGAYAVATVTQAYLPLLALSVSGLAFVAILSIRSGTR